MVFSYSDTKSFLEKYLHPWDNMKTQKQIKMFTQVPQLNIVL